MIYGTWRGDVPCDRCDLAQSENTVGQGSAWPYLVTELNKPKEEGRGEAGMHLMSKLRITGQVKGDQILPGNRSNENEKLQIRQETGAQGKIPKCPIDAWREGQPPAIHLERASSEHPMRDTV